MNPSKRDMEAFKLFYDLDDEQEASRLILEEDWDKNEIISCTYDKKDAIFSYGDIETAFFPGCEPVQTVIIKFKNNKTKLVPFRRKDEEGILVDLFTLK